MKKLLIVIGTRPNFIKVTQFPRVLEKYGNTISLSIVHTGQHFDDKMSTVFFNQFGFQPDVFLHIGQGSPVTQIANIMSGLEKVMKELLPNLVMVVGDVNSTLAAGLTANKMGLKIAHLESGLRSFDRDMPEEINRVLTDEISDHFFITEESGYNNLIREGKDRNSLHFVGNTMIDTLVYFEKEIEQSDIIETLGLDNKQFVLMTMHRPATVDHKENLLKLLELIDMVTVNYKLVFPIHPRTLARVKEMGLKNRLENQGLILTDPLDYFAFQKLIKKSQFILTDSGGIQEESTYYQVPCLTLRGNTERPSTVTLGSNELVPFDLEIIKDKITDIENGRFKKGTIPPLWDGKATERIVDLLPDLL